MRETIFVPDAEIDRLIILLRKIKKNIKKNKKVSGILLPVFCYHFDVGLLYEVNIFYDRNGILFEKTDDKY